MYLSTAQMANLALSAMKRWNDRAGEPPPIELLDGFLAWASEDQFSYTYGARIFENWRTHIERWHSPLDGLRILEIGPGRTLVTGALLYACGASRYAAVDLFPLADLRSTPYVLTRRFISSAPIPLGTAGVAANREATLARFDGAIDTRGERVEFTAGTVQFYCPVDAAHLPFDSGEFDVVLSNAVLEHVADPSSVVDECLRVLVPGGVGLHQIDFRDHRDFSDPLAFLRHSSDEWRRINEGNGDHMMNRWRLSRFITAFQTAESEILNVEAEHMTISENDRARLHVDFSTAPAEDLSTLGALFVVRRKR
jgi:SAM-dependent methyltransferase